LNASDFKATILLGGVGILKLRLFLFGLLLCAPVMPSVGQAGVNLISNGGFQTGDFTDWTVAEPTDINAEVVSVTQWSYNFGAPNDDSTYEVAFNPHDSAPVASLSQTFATTNGVTYTVSFEYGTTDHLRQTGPQSLIASVIDGSGATLATLTATAQSQNPSNMMVNESFTFVADGSSATIQFQDDPSNDTTNLDGVLDNVAVYSTPEPASVVVWGILIAGWFAAARRNRKS
jgi:hypothetical protein